MGLPMQFAQGYGGGNSYRGSGGGYRPQPRPNPYAATAGGINPYRTSPPQSAPQQDPRMSWEAPNMKPPSGPKRSIEPIKQPLYSADDWSNVPQTGGTNPVKPVNDFANDPRYSEEGRKQREAERRQREAAAGKGTL